MTTQTATEGAGALDAPSLRTLTFECASSDEAFRIIAAHKASGYWAHIICLSDGAVTLHLRPLEPLPDL